MDSLSWSRSQNQIERFGCLNTTKCCLKFQLDMDRTIHLAVFWVLSKKEKSCWVLGYISCSSPCWCLCFIFSITVPWTVDKNTFFLPYLSLRRIDTVFEIIIFIIFFFNMWQWTSPILKIYLQYSGKGILLDWHTFNKERCLSRVFLLNVNFPQNWIFWVPCFSFSSMLRINKIITNETINPMDLYWTFCESMFVHFQLLLSFYAHL